MPGIRVFVMGKVETMDEMCAPQIGDLIDRHYQAVYRFAYRLTGDVADAEDLTQVTFLAAHRKLHDLRNPEFAWSWLCSIARNTYVNQIRKANGHTTVSLEGVPEPCGRVSEDMVVDEEELQRALDELPEEFRSVLILYYFQQCSYREIVEILEVPIGTVMSRLARGKRHLRQRLLSRQPALSSR